MAAAIGPDMSVVPRTRDSVASCCAPASAAASAAVESWLLAVARTAVSTDKAANPTRTGNNNPNNNAVIPRGHRRAPAFKLRSLIAHPSSTQGFSLLSVAEALTVAFWRKYGVPTQLTCEYGTLRLTVIAVPIGAEFHE